MAVKIVFVFLLAALVVQKSELSPATEVNGNLSRGIIDEALKLAQETIKYLTELIKGVVELAMSTVDNTLRTILDKANDIQKGAQEALGSLLQSVVEAIETAKEKALAAGADISECITGQEEATKEAIEEVTEEIAACVSDKVSEVKQETEELLNSVRDAIKFSEEAGNTIIACFNLSGPFKVLDCVVTETSKAGKQAASVATSIRNKVIEVEKFLLLAVRELSQCAGASLQKAQQRVADILRSITVCVDGKLNSHAVAYETPLLLKLSN